MWSTSDAVNIKMVLGRKQVSISVIGLKLKPRNSKGKCRSFVLKGCYVNGFRDESNMRNVCLVAQQVKDLQYQSGGRSLELVGF